MTEDTPTWTVEKRGPMHTIYVLWSGPYTAQVIASDLNVTGGCYLHGQRLTSYSITAMPSATEKVQAWASRSIARLKEHADGKNI